LERKAVAIPPIDPRVEIIPNPIAPQPQAPADAPKIEPNTPPLIFFLLLRNALILYTFIDKTNPDKIETAITSENRNASSYVTYITTYGSKKMYSDNMERGTNIAVKIIPERIRYL